MKNLKKLFLMSILAVSSFVLSGIGKVEAADVFTLGNLDIVCDPAKVEKGKQATCYIVGVPSKTGGTVHGYIVKAYTTKHLKLAGATAVVTSTGQAWADATSATKQITPNSDMPEQVKTLSCAYDGETLGNITTTSYGCGVFYTVKDASNAFSATTVTSDATKSKINTEVFPNSTYGTIGAIIVKLDENFTGEECGEICVKPYRIPTVENYTDYSTCGNTAGTGCGVEFTSGNFYKCKEIKAQGSGTDPETGAFASYAILAACAFIAVSAITLAKKNNKFSRI